MDKKVCTKCGEEKSFSEFYRRKASVDGLGSRCKVCNREYLKKWHQENKEYYREYRKKYRQENEKSIKEDKKKYYQENREYCREYSKKYFQENKEYYREYKKKYYQDNPQYKVGKIIRVRTRLLVQQGKAKKFCGYNDYIGCTPQELVEHLESQFYECPSTGRMMTWDNHGEWHIDHIRPLASFDLMKEEDFMQAHNYTNLQPLWAEENLSKGASWDEDP